jgi:hypothetical protein
MHANVDKESEEDENLFVQHSKGKKGVVDKNYLLLDNQSTVNQVTNPSLLTNIRKADKPIVVHCNVGSTRTDLIGELGNLTVHHNPESIANVLSLKSVALRHHVTYDSRDRGGVFQVHMPKGVVEFRPSEQRLHYLDMNEHGETLHHMLVTAYHDEMNGSAEEDSTDDGDDNVMMVSTVRNNFEGFTKHEIKMAQEARRLQGMIGNPTEREFEGMVREKLIANCPITVHDIKNANRIFGPDLANLRGKMTRTKPERVRVEYVNVPRDLIDMHKYISIVANVMFVNGLPFMVTSSRGISLITIEFLPSRTIPSLVGSLRRVVAMYAKAGFIVQTAMMDMEFEKLKNIMPELVINREKLKEGSE